MKTLLLILCFSLPELSFSQQTHRTTYISVTLEQNKGELTKKNYLKIVEGSGNQFAWDIISLVHYDEWNNNIYTDMFYNGYLDSTKKYYNYFERPADAFQFLADNRWELVTIYQDSYSDGQFVYAKPVFYFRKEIK